MGPTDRQVAGIDYAGQCILRYCLCSDRVLMLQLEDTTGNRVQTTMGGVVGSIGQ